MRGLTILLLLILGLPAPARDRWSELNIGPFYIYSHGDTGAARDDLTQLEQLRWVLEGLLESKDLHSLWPIRIVLTRDAATKSEFIEQNGQYVLACAPGAKLPLDQVAGILLDDNTPRLPPDAEQGLRELFSTLEAHGSRVNWGGAIDTRAQRPADRAVRLDKPDLAFARMQLFATKFEYSYSFHVFVTSLKNGSSIRISERNAFGKDPDALEKEAAANLASGNWQAVSVSGRPLDPKRDFGEHSVDAAIPDVFVADTKIVSDPKAAEAAFKAAIEAGEQAMPLGYEGLAALARQDKQDSRRFLEDAIRSGSTSAPVYVHAAEGRPDNEALPLLKKAALLNPMWAEPVYQQAQLATDSAQKEALLKKAALMSPRATRYWTELAELQLQDGHAIEAQGSWLRAEDSAATGEERERIQKMRTEKEQERLDAAEAERRNEREAAHLDDKRAQDAELARIRAAEAKANQSIQGVAGEAQPADVVPWDATVPKKKLVGTLIRVDCLRGSARLSIKDKAGATTQLLLQKPEEAGLNCGNQQPPRRVAISYAADPDDRLHTSGRVVTINLE